jgi:micrococcal nuclease
MAAQAETIESKVVKIADGDTLTLLTPTNQQVKIRLAGIDTPERKQPFLGMI